MEPYIGEIRLFAGDYAPQDWAFCDGSLLSITQYGPLHALIGTTYGGDGVTNFALPDLRGCVPVGVGQGPGLTARVLGERGGAPTVTLTEDQVAAHSHRLVGTTGPATSAVPGPNMMLSASDPTVRPYNDATLATGTFGQFNPASIGPSGAQAQPHENHMPSIGLNYIIALNGIVPTARST